MLQHTLLFSECAGDLLLVALLFGMPVAGHPCERPKPRATMSLHCVLVLQVKMAKPQLQPELQNQQAFMGGRGNFGGRNSNFGGPSGGRSGGESYLFPSARHTSDAP